jgi:Zn-dependent alcohol dehydrogenase
MVDFPAIFGHEGAGYVRALGRNSQSEGKLRVGDPVLLSFNVCGECKQCRGGHPAYCHIHPQVNHNAVRLEDRSTPARLAEPDAAGKPVTVRSQYFGHSSFAKMSVVHRRSVVGLAPPAQLLPHYSALGCGFQTGSGTVLNVLKPEKKDSLVVFGLGGVGLSAVMAAKYLGVEQIVGVDLVQSKLDLARELGLTDAIDPKDVEGGDTVRKIKEVCKNNGGATYAIDCTGVLKVIEQCIECLAPCGTAVTVGNVTKPEIFAIITEY